MSFVSFYSSNCMFHDGIALLLKSIFISIGCYIIYWVLELQCYLLIGETVLLLISHCFFISHTRNRLQKNLLAINKEQLVKVMFKLIVLTRIKGDWLNLRNCWSIRLSPGMFCILWIRNNCFWFLATWFSWAFDNFIFRKDL